MASILSRHWHHLPSHEVLELLETDPEQGLDILEAGERHARFGPNALSERRGKGPLLRFLLQFHQALVYILLAAGTVTILLGEWTDAGVIFGVVLVNAVVGSIQESRAIQAIEALARIMTREATVIRGGRKQVVESLELVPGDIVSLQPGDKVAADLRLLHAHQLNVDESALTGESLPAEKHAGTLKHDTILADRRNMAYSSTLVTAGSAVGVVVATGDDTEIGRISALIAEASIPETPLTRKIAAFSRVLLYVILGLAAMTFVVGALHGESWPDMFMAAVALAVGAIPEGLPAALTITLAIGVGRMAKRRAIIRKLPAVETLGSTTVICSDKTGTLTKNQMTVLEVMAGDEVFMLSGAGYTPEGKFSVGGKPLDPQHSSALMECLSAGLLCNDSRLEQAEEGWHIEGDPTEGALIVAAAKAGLLQHSLSEALPRIDTWPFDARHRYMATLHDGGTDQPRITYLKGSIEALLPHCRNALDAAGEVVAVDHKGIQHSAHMMAKQGLRVLLLARGSLPAKAVGWEAHNLPDDLVFLGLQGMSDPPRPDALAAVVACRAAGIQVKMVTGDHAATALAIARQMSLASAGKTHVLSGEAIARLSDAEFIDAVETTTVFARVSPEQKLRLVEALQNHGHVVAMTGDGVNDAPALRQADIGVAMGRAGTEVAKEAAEMVLTDDNFASIEAAVEEGRGVYDNLVKFITWTLPTNLGEALVIMVAVLAGVSLPILPVQILWINMTTALLLGLTLAFESGEPGIMERPPRNPRQEILHLRLVLRIVLVGLMLAAACFGLFEWALASGASEAAARTVAVNMLVMGELFYLFNCRSLSRSMFVLGLWSNRWLLAGVAGMILLQLAFTYTPVMNVAFHSAPIGADAWIRIITLAAAIYAVVGMEKWIDWRMRLT